MARWLCAALLLAAARADRPPKLIDLFGWTLQLHENTAIRSPYYDECRFYRGRVMRERQSDVAVTECNGQLYGLVQVGNESFVLEPNKSDGAHVVRRRDLTRQQPPLYDVSGDTVDELDLQLEPPRPTPHVRTRHSDNTGSYDYFHDVTPVTRPVSGVDGLWLELAIVADHTMLKFHGRERVRHYILALMNLVSAIYNDPSLNSNMTLVIKKLYLIDEKDSVIKYGNARRSLEAVNKWNYRHLMKLPPGDKGWDAAVWLTRTPIGGPAGFAPVGGVCSRTRSAAIDHDEGLTSAFVIAHELAHLLGLTHDEGSCQSSKFKGSVMSRTVLATLSKYAWSDCSKKQFHEKSGSWWCLHHPSGEKGLELSGAKELPNYVFTMDEQCRTEFGEGFSVCKSVEIRSSCSRLWCEHRAKPIRCTSKMAPPLEGTPCGYNHWCVDQMCEPMPGRVRQRSRPTARIEPVGPPQWGEWSPWSECSATCGYGLKTSTRQCYHKRSQTNGCEGASSQVTTCWTAACAAQKDPRSNICTRQSPSLIAYLHDNESRWCEAWCVNYRGGEPQKVGVIPDGAPCSYDRPYDLCYQGACVRGRCNSSDPVCNWCPDGFCSNNTYFHTKMVGNGWMRMATIPYDARLVSVHIATPVPLTIVLRARRQPTLHLKHHYSKKFQLNERHHNYFKYDPNVPQNLQIVGIDNDIIDINEEGHFGFEGRLVAAGTFLRWKQTDTDVYITSTSRLQTELMILASQEHAIETSVPVAVTFNYSAPASRTRPLAYRWSTENGPCSASCGGGVRLVKPRCLREHDCAQSTYENCNLHACEFSWAAGQWEECSATCGRAGVQERQLFCVPTNFSSSIKSRSELVRASVSPVLCREPAPQRQQPCNTIPCPVYWQELPWTPCSATCGRGVSRRPLVCPVAESYLCGTKPRERHRRCRLRKCPLALHIRHCPSRDATHYCNYFTVEQLQRQCELPSYRKYCCNACKYADTENRGIG